MFIDQVSRVAPTIRIDGAQDAIFNACMATGNSVVTGVLGDLPLQRGENLAIGASVVLMTVGAQGSR